MGLSREFACSLVQLIATSAQIVSMDLVEINPAKAESQYELKQTTDSALCIISSALNPRFCSYKDFLDHHNNRSSLQNK